MEQQRRFKTRIQAVDVKTGQLGYFEGPEVLGFSYEEAKNELYAKSQFLEIYAEIKETIITELKDDNFFIQQKQFKLPQVNIIN